MFRRTDIGVDIPARFDRVVDTRLATVLADSDARIGTIEHVMAALAGCGIDNAVVEVDGPEPPILDGSARRSCSCWIVPGSLRRKRRGRRSRSAARSG